LEDTTEAEELIAALRACQSNYVEMDFSGLQGVGTKFIDQFIRLAEVGLAETWLTPRNYGPSCNCLVNRLLTRLKRQREQAWINGCEAFAAGAVPKGARCAP
jgi:hypothetical protein